MAALSLDGRAVFVTGPAKGMGADISLTLARAGADLVLAGRDVDAIEPVAEAAREMGREVLVAAADVTDEPALQAAAQAAADRFPGRLRGLVAVAGVSGPTAKTIWEHDLAEARELYDVNVIGAFLTLKHLLPHMIACGGGSAVTIGGTFGSKGVRRAALYASTKWALKGLTRSAAQEAGPHGVRVNMVSPGPVEGARLDRQFGEIAALEGVAREAVFARVAASAATGRVSRGADVAGAVLFLLSDLAANITGQDLLVDGGTVP